MTHDLFSFEPPPSPKYLSLAEGAILLRGRAKATATALINTITTISEGAPFRHMITNNGFSMSVAMTNCGQKGWVSDKNGYHYTKIDPITGKAWPPMPDYFFNLAQAMALEAGYQNFYPNSCLINQYRPKSRLSLHQDKDEGDTSQPIVSISLGLPALFQFGGPTRKSPYRSYCLHHGDVVVWGGSSRLFFHGIRPLQDGLHPLLGAQRLNLTFRFVS
ncbi:DNA oxidative demethylase AlkB [Bartonella sp. DGB2]|uniref:DNA oxidative demethylase AlkB n=1 Tax=Bartonella sp. DGB2 TaxID=3388426 RepID=UPI00399001B4